MTQDAIVRAERARQVLDDPLVKGAFEHVEAGLIDALKKSAIGDVSTHHELALSLQLLGSVRRQFDNWVRDGEVEQARIQRR